MIAMAMGFVVGLAILGGIVICVGFLWAVLRHPMEDERRAADTNRIIARLRGSSGPPARRGFAPRHRAATRH